LIAEGRPFLNQNVIREVEPLPRCLQGPGRTSHLRRERHVHSPLVELCSQGPFDDLGHTAFLIVSLLLEAVDEVDWQPSGYDPAGSCSPSAFYCHRDTPLDLRRDSPVAAFPLALSGCGGGFLGPNYALLRVLGLTVIIAAYKYFVKPCAVYVTLRIENPLLHILLD
jgi:hypothetical protein